jgi:hypothetical protein
MLLTGEPEPSIAKANRASSSIALIAVNPRIRTRKLLSFGLRRVLTSAHATVVE